MGGGKERISTQMYPENTIIDSQRTSTKLDRLKSKDSTYMSYGSIYFRDEKINREKTMNLVQRELQKG